MTDGPAISDHYRERERGSDEEGELFRVVGVGKQVTLLRLTEDGERTGTGDLQHVDRSAFEERFTPASNPDPRFGIPEYLAGLFVVGGVALAVYAPADIVSAALLVAAGVYLLWRRHG